MYLVFIIVSTVVFIMWIIWEMMNAPAVNDDTIEDDMLDDIKCEDDEA